MDPEGDPFSVYIKPQAIIHGVRDARSFDGIKRRFMSAVKGCNFEFTGRCFISEFAAGLLEPREKVLTTCWDL